MHPCPAPKCRDKADGNPTLVSTPMCPFHTRKFTEAIREFPSLYAQLHFAILDGTATIDGDVNVTGSKAISAPINTHARALQEDMLAVTRDAEVHYRLRKGWSSNYRCGLEVDRLADRCKWLAAHYEGVLEADADYGVRVLKIKHGARSLLGLGRLLHRLPAPCPECDCLALVRESGSSSVECRACGYSMAEESYGLLARVLAADLPASERQPRPTLASGAEGYGW